MNISNIFMKSCFTAHAFLLPVCFYIGLTYAHWALFQSVPTQLPTYFSKISIGPSGNILEGIDAKIF